MNNINAIGNILEMYAYYRRDHSINTEKMLSVAAAISALARSDEDYDEELSNE